MLTGRVAFAAFAIGLIALFAAIIPKARFFAGVILVGCALAVALYWWVWSVLIVGEAWGIGTLYVLNFFLGIGALLGGFMVALFGGHWGVLGQLILLAVIVVVYGLGGLGLANPEPREPAQS